MLLRKRILAFAIVSAALSRSLAAAPDFRLDLSASLSAPQSWHDSEPTRQHTGYDLRVGLEYRSPISIPILLEYGYLKISASTIDRSGSLFRGWDGNRLAILSGYSFEPFPLQGLGSASVDLLAGAAITAAAYTGTALAFAYPSILFEPRMLVKMKTKKIRVVYGGPFVALPIELMFREDSYTLSPSLSLGWSLALGKNP
jgi:hypothetical protein